MKSIIILALVFGTLNASAEDVYNFYFQKTDEASPTAITKEMAPVAPVQTLKGDLKTDEKKNPSLKNMELGIYRSWVSSSSKRTTHFGKDYDDRAVRDSVSILGSYRFNRYVVADGGFYLLSGWNSRSKDYSAVETKSSYEGSIGLSVIPLHLNVFGYQLLEVGVSAGVMTMTKMKVKEGTPGSSKITEAGDMKKIYGAYLGPHVALNLTRDLGLVFDLKSAANQASVTSVGLRYRF